MLNALQGGGGGGGMITLGIDWYITRRTFSKMRTHLLKIMDDYIKNNFETSFFTFTPQ